MSKSGPFEAIYRKLGANFSEYDDWLLVSDYGDPALESKALYEHCSAFDLSSFGRIIIKGSNSGELTDKLLVSDISKITDGDWVWSLVCDKDGSIGGIVRVGCVKGSYLLFTIPWSRKRVLQIARTCAEQYGLDEVQVEDITESTAMLGIYGPGALEAVNGILPLGISGMEFGGVKQISVFMLSVTILRGSWCGADGVELLCPASAAPLAGGAIARYHTKQNITPAGMDCLMTSVMEASVPAVITDPRKGVKVSPLGARFGHLVDREKDFFGKEGLKDELESGSKQLLAGLKGSGPCSYGKVCSEEKVKIQYDGLEIGTATVMIGSERFGCNMTIGVINNEFYDLADEVQVVGSGSVAGAEVFRLPFDKAIAAGLYQ